MPDKRIQLLEQIKSELISGRHLPLYEERARNGAYPVAGEGSSRARIMFIGEAPGKKEALTGKPFCGSSGRILDDLLASAGINREEVYITNVVNDRPPMNRDPFPEEIDAYAPFLERHIKIIQPEALATLGRFSMAYIFKKFGLESELAPISKLHGKVFKAHADYGDVYAIPLYHPAVAVYNSNMKKELIRDFKSLKDFK